MAAPARLLSHAEYARSRKARGLSGGTQQAVSKAVAQGRITGFGPDKLIDQQLADQQWARNTRARVATGAAPGAGAGGAAPDLPGLAAADGAVPPAPASQATEQAGQLHADPSYLRSRSAQAEADARIAQMKAAELEGSLVRIDQVRAELAARLAPVREGLLQIPARISAELAAQSDPARIQTALEAEIHRVLAPLGQARPGTDTGEAAG